MVRLHKYPQSSSSAYSTSMLALYILKRHDSASETFLEQVHEYYGKELKGSQDYVGQV